MAIRSTLQLLKPHDHETEELTPLEREQQGIIERLRAENETLRDHLGRSKEWASLIRVAVNRFPFDA